jgi:hypothetical protein
MGVWLPDGWMEDAPGDFPLTPLIPPGPPSLPAAGREGGKRVGFGGGGEAAAPKPPHFSPSPRRAAAAGRGPGGGVSPKGQVVSMPVYVWVNFLKFISQRLNSYLLQTKSAGRSDTSGTFAEESLSLDGFTSGCGSSARPSFLPAAGVRGGWPGRRRSRGTGPPGCPAAVGPAAGIPPRRRSARGIPCTPPSPPPAGCGTRPPPAPRPAGLSSQTVPTIRPISIWQRASSPPGPTTM